MVGVRQESGIALKESAMYVTAFHNYKKRSDHFYSAEGSINGYQEVSGATSSWSFNWGARFDIDQNEVPEIASTSEMGAAADEGHRESVEMAEESTG